jgi:hypothetical protein
MLVLHSSAPSWPAKHLRASANADRDNPVTARDTTELISHRTPLTRYGTPLTRAATQFAMVFPTCARDETTVATAVTIET